MFEDRMFISTGFSGKDLQRAIHKFGIYKERMAEAQKIQDQQQARMLAQMEKLYKEREEKKKLSEGKNEIIKK